MRVMKERLGLPDVLAAPAAAPAVAAPGAAGAAALVKYDAKDKIKVETEW